MARGGGPTDQDELVVTAAILYYQQDRSQEQIARELGVSRPTVSRLLARARERGAVLVATGLWPGETALRLRAEHSSWSGLGGGEGLLGERVLRVAVSGRGAAGRERTADLVTRTRAAA